MKDETPIHLIISYFSTLGRNAIPLGVVVFGGSSTQTAMVLYLLETVIGILLSALVVRLRAPAKDSAYASLASTQMKITTNGRTVYRNHAGDRRSLIQNFLIFSLTFSLVPGLFMVAFVFAILEAQVSSTTILYGTAGIFVFQLLNFGREYFFFRDMSPESANGLLTNSSSRAAVLYFSVFIGMILAAFVRDWFLIPFAVLKTLTELPRPFKRG